MSRPLETAKTKPHWYKCYYTECVLCGRGDKWRERQYTPKPEDQQKRHEYRQEACHSHFL